MHVLVHRKMWLTLIVLRDRCLLDVNKVFKYVHILHNIPIIESRVLKKELSMYGINSFKVRLYANLYLNLRYIWHPLILFSLVLKNSVQIYMSNKNI